MFHSLIDEGKKKPVPHTVLSVSSWMFLTFCARWNKQLSQMISEKSNTGKIKDLFVVSSDFPQRRYYLLYQ